MTNVAASAGDAHHHLDAIRESGISGDADADRSRWSDRRIFVSQHGLIVGGPLDTLSTGRSSAWIAVVEEGPAANQHPRVIRDSAQRCGVGIGRRRIEDLKRIRLIGCRGSSIACRDRADVMGIGSRNLQGMCSARCVWLNIPIKVSVGIAGDSGILSGKNHSN